MRYCDEFEEIWETVKPFTMTSKNRGFALYEAVNHVISNDIPGYFVECGVWRGGSSMIIALTLLARGITHRAIYLFDTFEGMTAPSAADIDPAGRKAADILADEASDGLTHAACDLETVRANMISTGYPRSKFAYIEGDIRETLPFDNIPQIALLRLDTDFEDSTAAELEHLYPLVATGGIMIIDDYGHWQGARKAVDAFLEAENAAGRTHFLTPLDYTGRLMVKPATQRAAKAPIIQRVDYVSPTMDDPKLLGAFTHLIAVDPTTVPWPYLRSEVPHVWRNDSRARKAKIGVLSVDEGAVLLACAAPFKGMRGLEIGCHLAFSTAHLLKAGLDLDVIDPALGDANHLAAVQDSLKRAAPDGAARLNAGFSPNIVNLVQGHAPKTPWSFAFIDGLHDGTAPLDDARAVEPNMAETAAVMFHDLTCPDVAAGLRHYAEAGWKTRIYETMQVMGIAWRGDYSPPDHIPDPAAKTRDIDHLSMWQP